MSKLNGWRRLGLALSGLYFLAIAFGTWATLPTAAQLPHLYALYGRMPLAQKHLILNTQVKPENETAFATEAAELADTQLVEMPNSHTLVFRAETAQPEVTAAAKAYWAAAEVAASRARWMHILQGFAWWATPIFALYLLWLIARWIYRGFRPAADPSAA